MTRTFLWLVLSMVLVLGSAHAKTVRTDTIRISPVPTDDSQPLTIDTQDELEALEGPLDTAEQTTIAPPVITEVPEVHYGDDDLPPLVARMRSQLYEAAVLGDFERLRMVLESNEVPPTLSLTESGDPIEFLKESSGDPDGLEILAILADTLSAGYAHVDVGTPQEMYIWPYFAHYPFKELTKEQKIEMYRLITAGDFAEMESYGIWLFYRVGIGKDGTLHYFVAGE
ncbi:MAG: hypothetical protein HWE23_09815 [Rhodobacteraceae bacterium]|nr:hypothetical protein [Paracoccaceae bacterium]